MTLKVIGAGLGRTGTTSLMVALEHLLSGPCYHMAKIHDKPSDVAHFTRTAQGHLSNWDPNWQLFFKPYSAVTDWPAAAFYQSIMDAFPDAMVLLSYRPSEDWYRSCRSTIFPSIENASGEWGEMIQAVIHNTFTDDLNNKEACIAAYEGHNQRVRDAVPKDRLIEWCPGDGWTPITDALRMQLPDRPFPKTNTKEEFVKRFLK